MIKENIKDLLHDGRACINIGATDIGVFLAIGVNTDPYNNDLKVLQLHTGDTSDFQIEFYTDLNAIDDPIIERMGVFKSWIKFLDDQGYTADIDLQGYKAHLFKCLNDEDQGGDYRYVFALLKD